MTRIKYDSNLMEYISLFESITKASLKDCILDERLLFIVQENQIGKAIGKGGVNIRRIEGILKKKVRVVEFSPDVKQFIRNMVYPLQADVGEDAGIVTIKGKDTKTKGLLIGRDRANLNRLTSIVKRYFDVSGIRVV